MDRRAAVLVLAMTAATGCTMNRAADQAQSNILAKMGGGGQVIAPKRCTLTVATLARPLRDPAIDAAVWRVADEQALSPELRHALEVNGLRVGIITGDLPAEVESVLKAPPPHKVEPLQLSLPDGDHTLISLNESVPQASMLLNRDGQAFGKDYKDASGWYRVTVSQDGANSIALRLVPEIHHGPVQRTFAALPNAGTYAPQQFMQKDGQQEDTLRELAVNLVVQPGQVAVIGCRAEADRSLGSFLFTQTEANSDRLLQRVVLVWAARDAGNGTAAPTGLVPVEPPKT